MIEPLWKSKEEVLRVVALCAHRVVRRSPRSALKTKEVCRSTEAEAMVLTLTSDEPLVIDVAESLDGCYVVEQARRWSWLGEAYMS
jgi:hypothetical protein